MIIITLFTLFKASSIDVSSMSKPRLILFTILSFYISFILFKTTTTFSQTQLKNIIQFHDLMRPLPLIISHSSVKVSEPPQWLKLIRNTRLASHDQETLKVGLINFEINDEQFHRSLGEFVESFDITFEHISSNVTWKQLISKNINQTMEKMYPKIPMPDPRRYPRLNVVVAQLPCGESRQDKQINISSELKLVDSIKDSHRLQVSLATAFLVVKNGVRENGDHAYAYAVFKAKCEPMVEIFRCEDLIRHEGDYWVYKANVEKLRERLGLTMESSGHARPYVGHSGSTQLQAKSIYNPQATKLKPRQAYVTVLHSSDDYVCGAMVLAQSIRLTNTTIDLILLADRLISNHSIANLQSAGWKIKYIERIESPYAKKKAYNSWNYSKLRIWQLTEYDKVIFLDSDFIVLRNIDHIFDYPSLSAGFDGYWRFNSSIMLIEPSECMFETLMKKRFTLRSYNGGDQGYLNEIFTFWHELPRKTIKKKHFYKEMRAQERVISESSYTIHYFGVKPWKCSSRDRDCNWDIEWRIPSASDIYHWKWWEMYEAMPKKLQMYCKA